MSLLEEKQGPLLKKSSKSKFGISLWQERYFVLQKGKILIYGTEHEYLKSQIKDAENQVLPRKTIDMSHVTNVCFHYDRDAPRKSKRLFTSKNLEQSRFDIYTPTRVYNLKAPHDHL